MPKVSKPKKQNRKRKQIALRLDTRMAKDIAQLSAHMHTSPGQLLATLIWVAKHAMGRKVVLDNDQESLRLVIETFAQFNRLTDIQNGSSQSKK